MGRSTTSGGQGDPRVDRPTLGKHRSQNVERTHGLRKQKGLGLPGSDSCWLGQVPSLGAVKLKVGGGSYTRHSPERFVSGAKKKGQINKRQWEAPPEIVSDLAQRLAGDLWKAATAEAQMGLAAAREALNLENKRLQEEMTEVLRSADLMATQMTEIQESC